MEAIAEADIHHPRRLIVHIDVDAAALVDEQRPQIVEAVRVVGVFMRDQDTVDPVDMGADQLLAQVRAGVDKNARHAVGAGALN